MILDFGLGIGSWELQIILTILNRAVTLEQRLKFIKTFLFFYSPLPITNPRFLFPKNKSINKKYIKYTY